MLVVGIGIIPLVAVNPVTNQIYVANSKSTYVDGDRRRHQQHDDCGRGAFPLSVAVNPVTNKIYVANVLTPTRRSRKLTVIDGVTNTPTTIGHRLEPLSVAVNPVTNQIYVAN